MARGIERESAQLHILERQCAGRRVSRMLADRTYRHCCPGVGHSSNYQVTAVQSGNDMHHCAGIRCGRGPRRLVEPYCQCQRLRRLDQGCDRRESQTATTTCGSISRPRFHLTRELHSDPVTQALLQWLRYPTPVNSQHRPSRIRRSAWAHQHFTRRPQARLDSRQRFFVRSPWTRAPV